MKATRKKVLLYNPKAVFFDLPLALLSVGSMLDDKHYEVIVIDGRIDKDPLKLLAFHAHDALLLGITALTGNPLHDALTVSREMKDQFPSLPIVWGGWHPSLFPVKTLEDEPSIDITVQGQGEVTFRELIACIDAGSELNSILGIAFRDQYGNLQKNPSRGMQDLNVMNRVNYDLIDPESYFQKKGQRQLDYISSTGCLFRCSFCADPFVYERKWTGIEPQQMVEDLDYWYKKYRFTDINFQDETFFTKRKRVIQIAEALLSRNIKTTWAATMRADQGSRMTEEDFDLCKKSGLRRVLVGVESGSQKMLDWLNKDIKLEDVFITAQRCAKRNIAVIFPFIVGFPNETEESVRSTLRVAKELNSMHPGFSTPIFYFKPYPGSKITNDVVRAGYQLPNSIHEWADFDYIGSSGPWVNHAKYKLIENFKFYNKLAWSSQSIIFYPIQEIARFRTNHSFFKLPIERILAELLIKKQKLS